MAGHLAVKFFNDFLKGLQEKRGQVAEQSHKVLQLKYDGQQLPSLKTVVNS